MEKPRILHFLTPLGNLSPFDVNMAVDAGFAVAGYTGIGVKEVTGLTQDAMFSRAPEDAAKTVLFIGGRDAMLALDMAEAARNAMFPPFQISVFADPSGAFTTAALVERGLVSPLVTLPATALVGGVLGLVVGMPSLRLKGLYLALGTLAMHHVVLYAAGEMQARQRFAHRGAMTRIGSADPHAVEKRDDRGRATRKGADHRAAAVLDRLRARQPAGGEMLHQSEKERQVARGDATLI